MTQKEAETLAVLAERVTVMAKQLDKNTQDTASIKSAIDNLSGGKQALVWFTGVMISVLLLIATWLGLHRR